MSKYRIVYVEKEGFYKYWEAQRRIFLVFWVGWRAFNSKEEASIYIKDQEIKETRKITKGEC